MTYDDVTMTLTRMLTRSSRQVSIRIHNKLYCRPTTNLQMEKLYNKSVACYKIRDDLFYNKSTTIRTSGVRSLRHSARAESRRACTVLRRCVLCNLRPEGARRRPVHPGAIPGQTNSSSAARHARARRGLLLLLLQRQTHQ